LNRIEEGALDVDVAEFDAERAIDELLESVRAVAHRKGQTLVKDVSHPDSIFEPLTSDRVLVGQIMENLVSNAIKYSPFGATIRIGLVYTLAGLRFEIDDQGPGFTEEDKKRMFGRFVRLSAQPTGGESSTGLGLSLVKMLTELLGGTVECSSLSTGSRFTVFLPYSLSPHAVPATI
jgi:signal transduction histidine kinase